MNPAGVRKKLASTEGKQRYWGRQCRDYDLSRRRPAWAADWKAISGYERHAPAKMGASRIHGTLNHLDSKVRITTTNQ